MMRFALRLALVAGLPVVCLADAKVTAVTADPVSVYELQADGLFVRNGKLSARDLPLPTPLLEQHPKGYVKVSLSGKDVWLDSMDAEVFPPPGVGESGCVRMLGGSASGISRGAGEGCP